MIAVNYCSNEHLPARKAFINHRYLLNLKAFLILKIKSLRYSRPDITDSVNQTTKLEQGGEGGDMLKWERLYILGTLICQLLYKRDKSA